MENRKYKYIYFGSNIESEIEFENLKEEKFDNPEVIIRFTEKYNENELERGLTVKEEKIICKKKTIQLLYLKGNI